jgi:aspartyl-tRNA(Asn)/glutamyl-tRNA(Gln) amidotransferase subunit A
VVRGRILAGNYFLLKKHYTEYFLQALKIRRLVQQDFLSCWANQIDCLVTPVTLTDAPSYEEYMQEDNRTHTARQDYCTQPVNLAGLPAVTLPVKLSARSLPLAVQLIGPFGSDLRLLRTAARLEQLLAFPRLVMED